MFSTRDFIQKQQFNSIFSNQKDYDSLKQLSGLFKSDNKKKEKPLNDYYNQQAQNSEYINKRKQEK
jgi:hypothetical protein